MAKHHGMKHHDGKHHGKHEEEKERKKGGRVGMWVSGNPDVKEEAEDDEDGAETGHERKRGGKVKKKHHRATGGKVLGLMTGGGVKARLDRPGRKSGGAVGANRSPLSTAHNAGGGGTGSSSPADTYRRRRKTPRSRCASISKPRIVS